MRKVGNYFIIPAVPEKVTLSCCSGWRRRDRPWKDVCGPKSSWEIGYESENAEASG